jgi:hypothetical protein
MLIIFCACSCTVRSKFFGSDHYDRQSTRSLELFYLGFQDHKLTSCKTSVPCLSSVVIRQIQNCRGKSDRGYIIMWKTRRIGNQKKCAILEDSDRKEEGKWDGQRRDGGTNSTLRIKEEDKRLTLNEHDDDDRRFIIRYFHSTLLGRLNGREWNA